ncbi:MAG TPA: DNA mismatch repair protein MutS [Polyangiaceae bacterium]|nr:DNA mismatch repair protein MutS [Polyangiaceae bacterium]
MPTTTRTDEIPHAVTTPREGAESTPRDGHEARQRSLDREALQHARTSRVISGFRLVTFVGAAALVFARGFGYLPFWCWWLAAALGVAFAVLVVWHARLDRIERRVQAAIAFHRWAILRIDGKFSEYPSRGERFRSDEHPYTADLDVFGEASLFQLIDSTHTRRGEDTLARWLTESSALEVIVERQGAVRELVPREALREKLAVLGTLIRADKPDPGPLVAWAESAPVVSALPLAQVAAFALPTLLALAFVLSQLAIVPSPIVALVALGQWLYALSLLPKVEPIAAAVSAREGALAPYRSMLELIAAERFETPLTQRLQAKIGAAKESARTAPEEIGKLSAIAGFLDARQNEVFRFFIGPLFLWDLHCVLALERWQVRAGRRVRSWLDAIGEFEALASLAGFAHDQRETTWPILGETSTFRAKALGHPLIDARGRVTNDVSLRGSGTALLVTGSNMSGKSTLLRSMGTNAVLAMAGAPVVAEELVMAPIELRTSMWARDSLAKGVSHFYAELEKLKRVVDGIEAARPLFFLLDEILQGTNSRERIIGARSVLRHLLERGAMGAISTHDVGLLDLGPGLDARVDKVHFEEQVSESENGKSAMSFDYKLRPGVVRSTNALRLMRRVGIDVDLE